MKYVLLEYLYELKNRTNHLIFPCVKTDTAKDFKFDPNTVYLHIWIYVIRFDSSSLTRNQEYGGMVVLDKNLYETNSAQLVELVGS